MEKKIKELEIQLLTNLKTIEKYEDKNYQKDIEILKNQKVSDDELNEKILNNRKRIRK